MPQQPTPPRSPAPPPPPPREQSTEDVPVGRMSPSLSHFAPAMVQVQLKLRPVIKRSENPHFKSTFANLAAILEEALPVLGDHGFALMQFPTTENGSLALMSMLIHESGQYVSATMPLMVVKQDPQGEGSAISYGRRYAACAILGIRTADDDGEEASGRAPRERDRRDYVPPPEVEPPNAEGWATADAERAAHGAAAEQIKQLFALIPEDSPIRAEVKAYRDDHGWPMAAGALTNLAVKVAKWHGEATAAHHDAIVSAGQEEAHKLLPPDAAPEAAAPAPVAPSAPTDRICPWCEKPVIGPKVIRGGTSPDDPLTWWHKACNDEKEAEDG